MFFFDIFVKLSVQNSNPYPRQHPLQMIELHKLILSELPNYDLALVPNYCIRNGIGLLEEKAAISYLIDNDFRPKRWLHHNPKWH